MKEIPILFSAPMVRAILEGQKTQTRRIMKPQPDGWIRGSSGTFGVPKKITNKKPTVNGSIWQEEDGTCYDDIFCPYGQPGDLLWVRETWAKQLDGKFIYRSDFEAWEKADYTATGNWKPSIFMPRAASRILLKVQELRVERLQDINEWDAIDEGIEMVDGPDGLRYYANYGDDNVDTCLPPIESYRTLWEYINGTESWDENPYVWVLKFKRVKP